MRKFLCSVYLPGLVFLVVGLAPQSTTAQAPAPIVYTRQNPRS